MYYNPYEVDAIHRERLERLRPPRNPRRGWRGGPTRTPRQGPRSDRER